MWPRWGAIGHDFILTLQASDCPYSGHAGYTYLDPLYPRVPGLARVWA